MKGWKKTIPSIGFAIAGVAFLFAALEERVIDGGPIHYTWLCLAFMFFAIAFMFFAIGRKSGGGTGPPNA
jgi:NADH:ubiquinone oxidoreductase subunit 6 (subunit J)